MIHFNTLSLEWVQVVADKLGKIDRALLEKAIRALFLTEQLKLRGLPFQFKGGTSLLLHLKTPRRFSIDVDIITTASSTEVQRVINEIIDNGTFSRWEQDLRPLHQTNLLIEHYKLFYKSHFPGFSAENYVLLDVIYQSGLPIWVEEKPMEHEWLQEDAYPVFITTSSKEGLLGEKLTAFAPETTGILYTKNRPVEIIKQLYDIGTLFDIIEDISTVRSVLYTVATQEIVFRKLSILPDDVLTDILNTALCICDRNEKDPNFLHLKIGINNIKPHIFQRFSIDDAVVDASKVMYLIGMIQQRRNGVPERFTNAHSVVDQEISTKDYNRFNRYKRSNPEAFFYILKFHELLN